MPAAMIAETERAAIVKLVAEGKSLAEIQAAVGDPVPAKPGAQQNGPRFEPFSQIVYDELTQKAQ